MATQEAQLIAEILRCHGARGDMRIFRQNTAQGWAGQARRINERTWVYVTPGDVVVRNAWPLHAGLCTGSSDLIGWHIREVTPDLIGQRVAVFAAIEAKAASTRLTAAQRRFLDAVDRAGGVAGVARSAEDVAVILGDG